jgi:hypothetical protein
MGMPVDNEDPSRRERKPLPDCLTRLLHPSVGHLSHSPAAPGSDRKTYVRVLAATWVHLDRLAQLTDAIAERASEPDAAAWKIARRR